MKSSLFSLILVSCLILLGFSCGKRKTKEDPVDTPNSNEYRFTNEMRAGSVFSEAEFKIAQNICESFEAMEERLQVTGGNLALRIQVKNKRCTQEEETEDNAPAQITSSRGSAIELNLLNGRTQTFTDILSTKHPRLSPFCESILAGENRSNTIESGNFRYQVTFYEGGNFERVQIAEFRLVDGRFMPYLIEKSAVITPYAATNRENLGFTRSRTINTPCSGSEQAYQFQLWL